MLKYFKKPTSLASKSGFTLVELSIVIVIVGLIVAGITAGRSLVKQAQLRSVITEVTNYRIAYTTFRSQYNALAGDIMNAYNYWNASCAASAALCNGNGNRQIEWFSEGYSAWQHLALAKLIPGNYTGQSVPQAQFGLLGTGLPIGKIKSTGYTFQYYAIFPGSGNHLLFGKLRTTVAPYVTDARALSPSDAYNIDIKMDDGLGGGQVRALKGHDGTGFNGTCHNGASSVSTTGDTYRIDQTGEQCAMYFIFPI